MGKCTNRYFFPADGITTSMDYSTVNIHSAALCAEVRFRHFAFDTDQRHVEVIFSIEQCKYSRAFVFELGRAVRQYKDRAFAVYKAETRTVSL